MAVSMENSTLSGREDRSCLVCGFAAPVSCEETAVVLVEK